MITKSEKAMMMFAHIKMVCDGALSLEMLEYFYEYFSLHDVPAEKALAYCAEKQNLELFNKIIELHQPNSSHFTLAWSTILRSGNLDMVKFSWGQVSASAKNNYILDCVYNKNTDVLRYCHHKNPMIDGEILVSVFKICSSSWHQKYSDEAITFLIDHCSPSEAYIAYQSLLPHQDRLIHKPINHWTHLQQKVKTYKEKSAMERVVSEKGSARKQSKM